jgi:RNA polymerase sigma-70 factor (ECF subfamily)
MAEAYDLDAEQLRRTLLDHAPTATREALAADRSLAAKLEATVAAARARWPGVAIEPAEFVRYLAQRLAGDPPGAAETALSFAADVYLACGCARGDAAALAAFEAAFLAHVPAGLPRTPDPQRFADEVKALVREKLFVAAAASPPKIAEYAGRCDLASWIKVVVVRTGLDLLRKRKPEREQPEDLLADLPSPGDDPELAHLKARYGAAFQTALRDAATALSPRDRNLLRQHHVDGLTVDQLARVHQIHRVTAVRWVVAARETLASETRRLLEGRLAVDESELASIMRLVRSEIDFSLRGILQETEGLPPP